MRSFIRSSEAISLMYKIKEEYKDVFYIHKTHTLYNLNNENKENKILRLPLAWPYQKDWNDYFTIDKKFIFMIIIIQSGQATIGVFNQNLDIFEHKVFRSYMVRKKQGKNQIKYLKTKGKSRAGSRIRLKNTYLFFEDINRYLEKWVNEYNINRTLYHISKMLKPIWKSSKRKIPFEFDDKTLKLPFDITSPTFEEMKKIARYSLDAEIKDEELLKFMD